MSRFVYQAIAVFTVVGFLTYLTEHFGFRSGLNMLWMFGVPVAVAIIANKDAASRCLAGLAGLALMVLSPVATIATAAVFGLGP